MEKKNLNLDVETVNELSSDELDQIAGGSTSAIASMYASAIASAIASGTSSTGVLESAAASAVISHVIEESLPK